MKIKLKTKMRTKMKTDTVKAAKRIIQVLHEEEIPLSLFDDTFKHTKELAMRYTVPYSPIELDAAFLANSTNKAKETEETQE